MRSQIQEEKIKRFNEYKLKLNNSSEKTEKFFKISITFRISKVQIKKNKYDEEISAYSDMVAGNSCIYKLSAVDRTW